jgi:hypothetical protein
MGIMKFGFLIHCRLKDNIAPHVAYMSWDESTQEVVIHDFTQFRQVSSHDELSFMDYFASLSEKDYYSMIVHEKKPAKAIDPVLVLGQLNHNKRNAKAMKKALQAARDAKKTTMKRDQKKDE